MLRHNIEKGTKVFNISLGIGVFNKWVISQKIGSPNPDISNWAITTFNNKTYFVPRTELTEIEGE